MRLTDGVAGYWYEKALSKGLRHLVTGQASHRTTSRLERHNRELRRRGKLGTVWTEHNLLALLPEQGLITKPPKTKRYPPPQKKPSGAGQSVLRANGPCVV